MAIVQQLQDALGAARSIPIDYNTPLRAVMVAPQAVLHRESVEGEAAVIGAYDPNNEHSYDIPDRVAENILSVNDVKLLMRDAELEVFSRSIGVNGLVAPEAGYKNRLKATVLNFKANGSSYPLSASLNGRDVQVGDKIVYGANPGTYTEHSTTVMDILPNMSAASVGAASASSGNKTTQSDSASFSQPSGTLNWVTGAGDASGYTDLNGGVNRVYTIRVIVGGDVSTAKLQVTSSDGLDDQASISPAAFASPTNIGTHGATVTFSLDNVRPVDSGAPNDLFVLNQVFQLTVAAAFTAPTATSGGTYTKSTDETLIITVTKGGLYADSPEITVTTASGRDASGPTVVPASGTNVAIGTGGAVIQFNQTGLCKNDIYYVVLTAPAATNMRTILLKDDLPTALLGVSDGNLSIRVIDTLNEIRPYRRDQSPALNWELDDPQIVVYDGITATLSDGSLTSGGSPRYVPVKAGELVVEYREWSRSAANQLRVMNLVEDTISELVSVDVDNPAGHAVGNGQACSNGLPVGVIGVADPNDVESWGDSIEALAYAENCYHICLATSNLDIIDRLIAHLNEQNASTVEQYRVGVVTYTPPSDLTIVDSTKTLDSQQCLVTIGDNPGTSGTQYNYVSSTNGQFVTNGVKAGDVLRTAYTADAYGVETYLEFVVSAVINENTLVTVTSSDVPYAVGQKAEIHRTPTSDEKVEYALAAIASRRSKYLRWCFADNVTETSGNVVPGYYLACSYGACLSAIAPHQPFNYFTIPGYTQVYSSGFFFKPKQLKTLEQAGFVVFDNQDGEVFVRRSVTTQPATPEEYEEAYVRSEHALIFVLRRKLSHYRGQSNNVPQVISKMSLDAQTALKLVISETQLPRLGSLIADGSTAAARPHGSDPTKAVLEVTGSRPYPLNDFTTSFLVPVNA